MESAKAFSEMIRLPWILVQISPAQCWDLHVERGKTDDKPEASFLIVVSQCTLRQFGVHGLSALKPPSGDATSAWQAAKSAVAP